MSTDVHPNPFGRSYTPAEFAAANRLNIGNGSGNRVGAGPLIYAGGDYWPREWMRLAEDYRTVAEAAYREWARTGTPVTSEPLPRRVARNWSGMDRDGAIAQADRSHSELLAYFGHFESIREQLRGALDDVTEARSERDSARMEAEALEQEVARLRALLPEGDA